MQISGSVCAMALFVRSRTTLMFFFFFFQAEDGIRDYKVTGVQTCALPICFRRRALALRSSLGWVREGPQFTLPVCFLRAAFRTPADQTAATGCCFTAFTGLHLLCTGSASADPRRSVLAWAA